MISTVDIQLHSGAEPGPRHRGAPWLRPVAKHHIEALLAEEGEISQRRRAELISAPGFVDAAQRTAATLVEHHRGNRVLNAIISDRGRFFATLFALDLHFRRHDEGIGLTPGRLKEQCAEQGICSATRAGALLSLMKLAGYVTSAPERGDRRLRELVPTERLITQQRLRWRCHFAGAAPFLPDAARALRALDNPEFVQGLVRLISSHFRAGFRFVDHAPALRLFSERNGGMFVLFSLLAAVEPGGLKQRSPIPVSISALARGISASRVHVLKLLKDAEGQGLLQRTNAGGVIILQPLERDLLEFFALGDLWLSYLARITLDHIGPRGGTGTDR